MAKTKEQKEGAFSDLLERLEHMKSAVIVSFSGLKVKDAQKLREKSWKSGVEYAVVKKTLLGIALKKAGLAEVDIKSFTGNVAVAFGLEDETSAPKLIAEFAKENEAMKILGGLLGKQYIPVAGVKSLASLPGKQELLGQLVGTIAAPMSGMLNVLQGNIRGLVQVLHAISKKS
ncbi:MAG: 50S ribosomal protein L10 [Patescibacteria group bacterium]